MVEESGRYTLIIYGFTSLPRIINNKTSLLRGGAYCRTRLPDLLLGNDSKVD
jgi:hypothetical protein